MKNLTSAKAISLLKKLSTVRVLCIGDVMLDRFLYGKVDRISPEAPVPIVHIAQEIEMLGGAGNVVQNITSLGAAVDFISVIGDDVAGEKIEALMDSSCATATPYFDKQPHQATTVKTRIIADRQQLVRVDRESSLTLNSDQQKKLFQDIKAALPNNDIVILSDYGKGVLNPSLNAQIIKEAQSLNIPVVVDPKSTHYEDYAGATFITPNLKEFQGACQQARKIEGTIDGDEAIHKAAQDLMQSHALGGLLVTRSQDGMSLIDHETHTHITTKAQDIFDVSGAGDTVVAVFSLALGAGLSSQDAAQLANAAAGIVVGKIGTASVTPEELINALVHEKSDTPSALHLRSGFSSHIPWDQALTQVLQWRTEGEKIGFTNGCFDILHPGHTMLLAKTKAKCDKLILALNSDASVTKLKGPTRPVNTQEARAQVLLALESVDLVVVFNQETPLELLKYLKPDLLIKGADYTLDQVVGAKEMKQWGGEVCLVDLLPGHSTTNTIKRL